MNHDEQLLQAFRSHEHLAPSVAAVSAGTLELARGYRRRRRVARAAGGAVVTAGLGAVAVVGPGLLDSEPSHTDRAVPFAAAATTPSTPPTPPAAFPGPLREAFFAAGYDYDDAVELARLWGRDATATDDVKAEAGRRLLAGERLPLAPGAGPAAPAAAPPVLPGTPGEEPYEAFLEAGYDWADAVALAELWGSADVLQTKALAGQKLLDGETLPIAP